MSVYIICTGCEIASRKSLKRRNLTQEGFSCVPDLTPGLGNEKDISGRPL